MEVGGYLVNDADGASVSSRGQWMEAVFEHGDLEAAWPLTTRDMRLAAAREWHFQGAPFAHEDDREAIAARLADDGPTNAHWPAFAASVVNSLLHHWPDHYPPFRVATWAVVDETLPASVDCEHVRLNADKGGGRFFEGE
jgi:hypothetical protein